MSNRKYGRTGITGVQTKQLRTCRECGAQYRGHHLTKECDGCRFRECKAPGCATRIKKSDARSYCSATCRKSDPSANKMAEPDRRRRTCGCGVEFVEYQNGSRRRYCSPECRAKYSKVGDRLRDNPELAREIGRLPKPNHGLSGYKQTMEHLVARLGTGAIKSSREELSLIPTLERYGFRHTGEGAFWRRWPDTTVHNPDFVNEESRTVLEYFGSYWHAPVEVHYAKRQWRELGYRCVIVWDYEREDFMADPQRWLDPSDEDCID